MTAVAVPDVLGGVRAGDIELIGALELAVVAVDRSIEDEQAGVGFELVTIDVGGRGRDPAERPDW